MAEAMDRPGLWQRAGLTGMVSGLAMTEALAGLPPGLDATVCARLFARAEAATLSVLAEQAEATEAAG